MIDILFGVWVFVVVSNLIMQAALILSARYKLRMMREASGDFTIVKKPTDFGATIRLMFFVVCPLLNVWLLFCVVVGFNDVVEKLVDNVMEL